MAVYDEYGMEMDELDFELADGYYDESGEYHEKSGYEDVGFDEVTEADEECPRCGETLDGGFCSACGWPSF